MTSEASVPDTNLSYGQIRIDTNFTNCHKSFERDTNFPTYHKSFLKSLWDRHEFH